MLEIQNLSKNYDGFEALQPLDLHIPRGEFFCFLGPNGAGKTTTIKCITGLLKPTTGRVLIDGRGILEDPIEAKRLIGYIPDTPYLYEKLSGREFFRFIGDLYGIPRREQNEAMGKYLEIFGLTHATDQLIENYSHGMRQKLCFAVAFMHRPRLMVVDEPMVGLDPKSQRILKNLLKEFCADGGTIFLSTHLLDVAQELSDRLGIVTRGQLRFLGTTEDLRRQLSQEHDRRLEDLFLQLTEEAQEDSNMSAFKTSPPGIGPDDASEDRRIAVGE
ncbi:MAG: ABC transporter ATP-binding protein [Sumerlaeia bacterium]